MTLVCIFFLPQKGILEIYVAFFFIQQSATFFQNVTTLTSKTFYPPKTDSIYFLIVGVSFEKNFWDKKTPQKLTKTKNVS